MEKNNICNCKCNLSECDMDMTIRECLTKIGIDPKAAETFLKSCCKDCCEEK